MMKYRSEIDGLRAIAVIVVIFFHAKLTLWGVTPFSGGFLGVDIFFVISGYLITGILLREMEIESFSFLKFYERRARRILPALFFVLFASIPMALILLFPQPLKDFFDGIIATTLFSSNILFWRQVGYFAEPNELNPLIHTWTLAIEEQFYIFFPMLLLSVHRFARKYLAVVLTVVLLGSLLLAYWASIHYPDASFFLLPTRGWEFLFGAALAKLERVYGRVAHLSSSTAMSMFGILLIGYSVVAFDESTSHPSFTTLLPVLGAAIFIWFGGKGDPISKLLSSKPLVMIGLISYSLYLWHQPIFVFARIKAVDALLNIHYVLLTFLSIVVAYLSWRFIEQPFRNRNRVPTIRLWVYMGVCTAILIIVGIIGHFKQGFPQRFPPIVQAASSGEEEQNKLRQYGDPCYGRSVDKRCVFAVDNPKERWIFVGDSHLNILTPTAVPLLRERDAHVQIVTTGACHYAPGMEVLDNGKPVASCTAKINNERRAFLLSEPPSIIVINGRLPLYLSGDFFDNQEGGKESDGSLYLRPAGRDLSDSERRKVVGESITKSLQELIDYGHKIILIYPIPEVGWNAPKTFVKFLPKTPYAQKEWIDQGGISTSYKVFQSRAEEAYNIYDHLLDNPNLIRVYPEKIFCNSTIKERCITHDDRDLYYSDDNHLSAAGVKLVVDQIVRQVQEEWDL